MSVLILTDKHSIHRLYTAGQMVSDTVQVVQIPDYNTVKFDCKYSAETILAHIKNLSFRYILIPNNDFLISVCAYMSACLNIPMISNVINIDKTGFVCKQYGGAILTTVSCVAPCVCIAVDMGNFEPYTGDITVNKTIFILEKQGQNTLKIEPIATADGLENANKIIVIGGGVTAKKDVNAICDIADKVGACVGATSPIINQGLMPATALVGHSGVNISPHIYVGIGVSGAVYHISGIRNAKTIIAVNLDHTAPLCQMADFVLKADYHEVLTDLQKLLT